MDRVVLRTDKFAFSMAFVRKKNSIFNNSEFKTSNNITIYVSINTFVLCSKMMLFLTHSYFALYSHSTLSRLSFHSLSNIVSNFTHSINFKVAILRFTDF